MGMDIHVIFGKYNEDYDLNFEPVTDINCFLNDGFRNSIFFREVMMEEIDAISYNETPKAIAEKAFFYNEKYGLYDASFKDDEYLFGKRLTTLTAWRNIKEKYEEKRKKNILSEEMYELLIEKGVIFPDDFDGDAIAVEDNGEEAIIAALVQDLEKVKKKYNLTDDETLMFYCFDN